MPKPSQAAFAGAVLAAALALSAQPGQASQLIGTTDQDPGHSFSGQLSSLNANWAVAWTQSVTVAHPSFRLVLQERGRGGWDVNWYVTRRIGPSATPGDVVASGKALARPFNSDQNFNDDLRSAFGFGGLLGPGTYFLVLTGPPANGTGAVTWVGDTAAAVSVDTAPGLTLGDAFRTGLPDPFPPSAMDWTADTRHRLAFDLYGQVVAPAPEPSEWAIMLLGLGLAGAALRTAGRRAILRPEAA